MTNGNGKKILVVEDELLVSRAMRASLERAGYEVATAGDGSVALDMMASGSFDLVFLDLLLPVTDGFDVLEALNKKKDDTPVIVSTNLSEPSEHARAMELGAVDSFVKSDVSLMDVVAKADAFLKENGGS